MPSEDRKLIKFSNYSLCVTLPKWVIKKLKWEKGNIVRMTVDEKRGEILIRKGLRIPKEKEIVREKTIIKNSNPKQKTKKARW